MVNLYYSKVQNPSYIVNLVKHKIESSEGARGSPKARGASPSFIIKLRKLDMIQKLKAFELGMFNNIFLL